MTKEEIEKQIAELKEEAKNVKGTKCEVYTRVVGYLRPVQGFNKGKREEFKYRKVYDVGNGEAAKQAANKLHNDNVLSQEAAEKAAQKAAQAKKIRPCCN